MLEFIYGKIISLLVYTGLYNRKKVFIMTFCAFPNYGTTLLNYALSEKIKQLGYSPQTIRWDPLFSRTIGLRNDTLRFFWFDHVNRTKICYTEKELRNVTASGNRIIFGGDTIFRAWGARHGQHPLWVLRCFGDFVSGKKAIASYAPSFALDFFDGDKTVVGYCKTLIRRFDKVSVREKNGVEMLRNLFGADSTEVLDPVFFLSSSQYGDLIKSAKNIKTRDGSYIAYMHFGDKQCKELKNNTLFNNKNILNICVDRDEKFVTVEQWLSYIKNADFIITNTYHHVAFAIIFHKPFLSIVSNGHDIRAKSLLENVGLLHLQKKSLQDITEKDLSPSIDWDDVDRKINERLAISEKFLKEALLVKPSYKAPFKVDKETLKIREKYEKLYTYRTMARKYRILAEEALEEQ